MQNHKKKAIFKRWDSVTNSFKNLKKQIKGRAWKITIKILMMD